MASTDYTQPLNNPVTMILRKPFYTLCLTVLALSLTSCTRHQISESAGNNSIEDSQETSDIVQDDLDELDLAELDSEYEDAAETDWKERSFLGNTRYTFQNIDGSHIIKGEADGKASLLYRQQPIDLQTAPWMSWRWKINNTYGDLNEREQSGDDFPARIYVVVQTGLLPWESLAINYVWSSNARIGDVWNNPFTDKAKMVVLRSGDSAAGQWLSEKRNIADDFKTYFNMDIRELSGYAVMVDGDNSGNHGTAWFTDIRFDAG